MNDREFVKIIPSNECFRIIMKSKRREYFEEIYAKKNRRRRRHHE